MKLFDGHVHLFKEKVINNVRLKKALVQQLKLQTDKAENRTRVGSLVAEMQATGVAGALILPTANAGGVQRINRECIDIAARTELLYTAGTLHPDDLQCEQAMAHLRQHRVRIIKLCTFSQGFVLNGPNALRMFDTIEAYNRNTDIPFAVILDTLRTADHYFGTYPEFNTTPQLLNELAEGYPGINFIGAHMGGLDAPYGEICTHLAPRHNLYLDTSNAAHTLSHQQFCELIIRHGPRHIIFGTDWPWFMHESEISLIDSLLDSVGFTEKEKGQVFYKNMAGLLGIVT